MLNTNYMLRFTYSVGENCNYPKGEYTENIPMDNFTIGRHMMHELLEHGKDCAWMQEHYGIDGELNEIIGIIKVTEEVFVPPPLVVKNTT